jgi:hypothetical protein
MKGKYPRVFTIQVQDIYNRMSNIVSKDLIIKTGTSCRYICVWVAFCMLIFCILFADSFDNLVKCQASEDQQCTPLHLYGH